MTEAVMTETTDPVEQESVEVVEPESQPETIEEAPQPEPVPDGYFLVNPDNEKIIQGESRVLPPLGASLILLFGLLLVGLTGGMLWGAYRSWVTITPLDTAANEEISAALTWSGVALIFLILTLLFYLSAFIVMWKRSRLQRSGEVVWGSVVSASGNLSRWDNLRVTVIYRFKQPKRRFQLVRSEYQRKVTRTRNDLKGKPLPHPGTPIAVFYHNKDNYEVL